MLLLSACVPLAPPAAFRLRHLDDDRARAVIEAVDERLRAWRAEAIEGRGCGIAFAQYKNIQAYAAIVREQSVTRTLHRYGNLIAG